MGETEKKETEELKPDSGAKVEEEKKYTQEDVNGIVRDRLSKVYGKFGVSDSESLEKKFQELSEKEKLISETQARASELEKRLAFSANRIDPAREDDVVTWFKGKGKTLDEQGVAEYVKTHPEAVLKQVSVQVGSQDNGGDKTKVEEDLRREFAKMMGFQNGFVKKG